jgi:hypothetical protein
MGAQRCPFCGVAESDRLDVDGRRILIFPCLFSPSVDPSLDEEALGRHLSETYRAGDATYFRGMSDRLHYFVTKGPGAHALTAPDRAGSSSPG